MIRDVNFLVPIGLFLLLSCYTVPCFSQNLQKADSLLQTLELGNLTKKERAVNLRSVAFFHPDLKIALFSAKQSLQIASEIEDPILQAEALEELSHLERRLGNNGKSLEASFKALRIYESLSLTERQAASYTQLASNYLSNKEYHSAINYLKRANHIYLDSDEKTNQALTILNLGEAYRLGGYLDSAATCFSEALKLNESIKNEIIKSYSLGNLGMVEAAQNELPLAKENLNKAIAILRDLGDPYSSSIYIAELGEIYKKERNWRSSEQKFLEAYNMAEQAGLKEQIRDFSASLAQLYESEHQYSKALEYQKLYQVYQDSLVNKENIQKIEQLKSGYELDKRETEINFLSTINTNQKYLVALLATGIFLLLLLAFLLYLSNKKIVKTNTSLEHQKKIISKREAEKAILLRELNHRVKNNLQLISSLLNLQSRELSGHPAQEAIEEGKYRVEALSLVHRKLYQEGLDTRINMKEYIESLVLGIFHGYGATFKPDFEIADVSINIDRAVPLALIVNELIINALKYAYKNISDPILKIIIVQEPKEWLDMQIIDNGIGFVNDKALKGNSFGIKLIHSLIEQLEGNINKSNKNGTHWKITVKLN